MPLKPYAQGAYSQEGVAQGAFAESADFFTGVYNGTTLPVDPYISGYAFIKWLKIPDWVKEANSGFEAMTEKNLRAFTGMDDIEIGTFAVNNGFTVSELMFPGAVQMPQGFTMTHNDFSGSPVAAAYTYWASGIRDPSTGLCTYPKEHGVEYNSRNHTGALLYIVTRPDANNKENTKIIEKAAYFSAVWPMKIALSQYNYTAGTNESPPVEMTFAAQRHIGQKVEEYAGSILSTFRDYEFRPGNDVEPVQAAA